MDFKRLESPKKMKIDSNKLMNQHMAYKSFYTNYEQMNQGFISYGPPSTAFSMSSLLRA